MQLFIFQTGQLHIRTQSVSFDITTPAAFNDNFWDEIVTDKSKFWMPFSGIERDTFFLWSGSNSDITRSFSNITVKRHKYVQ